MRAALLLLLVPQDRSDLTLPIVGRLTWRGTTGEYQRC